MQKGFNDNCVKWLNGLIHLNEADLPGFEAHLELTPYRSKAVQQKPPEDAKTGAVAIVINFNASDPEILLTKRADYKGTHGGQISFPGGKPEEQDLTLVHTALRETFEETGLQLESSAFVKALSSIYIPPSRFLVHPFLFTHHGFEETSLNHEVEKIITLPFSFLMEEHAISTTKIQLSDGLIIPNAPCFIYEGEVIWGATAAILNELRTVLRRF